MSKQEYLKISPKTSEIVKTVYYVVWWR